MKISMLGMTVAIILIAAPAAAFAGHYNLQVWNFATDNCDTVPSGGWCESVVVQVSTSTWCGSSCSWGEKTDTYNTAMNAIYNYWTAGLSSQGFRGMVWPSCPSTYLYCQSIYPDGYYHGQLSIWNLADYSAGSRNDYVTEISRQGFYKK